MAKLLSYIVLPTQIALVSADGTPFTVQKSHPNHPQILERIRTDGYGADVVDLLNPAKAVTNFGNGRIEIRGDELLFDGKALHNSLVDFIFQMIEEGFDVTPFTNFIVRLSNNPSFNSRRQLFDFITHHGLTITPAGTILFYKSVNDDYTDCHTGTIDNSVGAVIPRMDRSQVDDNPDAACSYGYHCGAHKYVAGFTGPRKILVEVDPADVVSVPHDVRHAKVRVTFYKVISELDAEAFAQEEPITAAVHDPYETYEVVVNAGDGVTFSWQTQASDGRDASRLFWDRFHGGDIWQLFGLAESDLDVTEVRRVG